ncbi:MAG: RHS repeat-associated core domain-containing protein [Flavobacteriaceae bacterium]|nr:RHS repeat-associated core domain-containing protein [Flavobacteriaceae bacterium]
MEYIPFGEVFLEEKNDKWNTPYKFNAKEMDEETGLYYYGARYYDSKISQWYSVDPKMEKYPHMSPYNYAANNPVKYIDPDGRDIVVPNKSDRAAVLKMINSKALGSYAFDKNGKLYQVKSTGDATKYSKYYADRLNAAIKDDQTIEIRIGTKINIPSIQSNGKGGRELKAGGGTTSTDVDVDYGGGVTYSINGGKGDNVLVYISGNENKNLEDENGNQLEDKPADILAHELVGHAIPYTVGTDTGNAVDNENKVRKEIKTTKQTEASPLRKSEPTHNE